MTSAKEIATQAEIALSEDRLHDANTLVLELQNLIGREVSVLVLQARVAILQKRLDHAVSCLLEGIVLEPTNADLHCWLGQAYDSQKLWNLAAEHAVLAIQHGLSKDRIVSILIVGCSGWLHRGGVEKLSRYLEYELAEISNQGYGLIDLIQDKEQLETLLTYAIIAQHHSLIDGLFREMFNVESQTNLVLSMSPVTSIEDWCQANDAPFVTLEKSREIEITAKSSNSGAWKYDTEPFTYAVIPRGECVSGWDFAISPANEVLEGSGYMPLHVSFRSPPHYYVAPSQSVVYASLGTVVDLDCDALYLSAPERFHFGHWQTEFLPRLRVAQELEFENLKIAIPTELPQKHRDTLCHMGIDDDQIVNCDVGRRYRFRNLITVQSGTCNLPNPSHINFLRRYTCPDDKTPSIDAPSRVFLSRGVETRMVSNQDEVDKVLHDFGIEKIRLSQLSIAEQKAVLSRAEFVIGVYGSDLHSAYMLPTGCHVVELIWDTELDPVTGPTCELLGLNHQFLVCSEATFTNLKLHKKDRDIDVDCAVLRQRLQSILG